MSSLDDHLNDEQMSNNVRVQHQPDWVLGSLLVKSPYVLDRLPMPVQ